MRTRVCTSLLVATVACSEPSPEPAAAERADDTPQAGEPEAVPPRPENKRTTIVRTPGRNPAVTIFGVQLTERPPEPGAWHWNWGEVMLGPGPTMPMIYVAPGRATIGSDEYESGRDSDETRHDVSLSEYWIGATEVTRGQYAAVMGSAPYCGDCSESLPVTQVSWIDAVQFCNALSTKLGLTACYREEGDWVWIEGCDGFRLPTESEWEHAARAGTTTPYHFGSEELLCHHANYNDSYAYCKDGHEGLAPVRSYAPNPWGLYDVHGNVREWVWDYYGPYSTDEIQIDPRGQAWGSARGLRGGSHSTEARFLRSAFRDSIQPLATSDNMGFRVARSAPQH